MTDVMIAEVDTDAVAKREPARPVVDGVDSELVDRLVEQARTAGLQLTGDGGLLQQLTKRVMESALDGGYLMYEGTRTTAITGVIESGDNVAISPLVWAPTNSAEACINISDAGGSNWDQYACTGYI